MQPQTITSDILREKYFRRAEHSVHAVRERIAVTLAAIEPAAQREAAIERFVWAQGHGFIAAGRIAANAGCAGDATLLNCFVQPIVAAENSQAQLQRTLAEATATLTLGGGVGYNFSAIAPHTAQQGGPGPLAFIAALDRNSAQLGGMHGRRGAQMAVLDVAHPDIEAFIAEKQRVAHWQSFNLSVGISDAFMRALHDGAVFELAHAAQPCTQAIAQGAYRRADGLWVYRRVDAHALWQAIIDAAYSAAEPGVLFLDRINRENNLHYCETIAATNPCAEQPLPAYGSCCLGSVDLTHFVHNAFSPRAHFDAAMMATVAGIATRMLDNVLDVTAWPLPEQRRIGLSRRRIGLGITGLGDALLMLGLRYDSEAAYEFAAHVGKVLRDSAYAASIDLAGERGAFPLFDRERYLRSSFIAQLPQDLRERIGIYGIRNSHLTSIAPTGSISLAFADNVSSGIEPAYAWQYERLHSDAAGVAKNYRIEDHAFRRWREAFGSGAKLPDYFVTAAQIAPSAHVRMAAAIAPYIDAGISKTVNTAADISREAFAEIFMQAWQLGLKGIAAYRPNAVTGAVLLPARICRK